MLSDPSELVALFILLYLIVALLLRGRFQKLPVWAIMLSASALTIISGLISVDQYSSAVDFEVIFFLIGMFSLVAAASNSDVLKYLTFGVLKHVNTVWNCLYVLSITMGLLAAIFLNDTVALMAPLIIMAVGKSLDVDLKPLTFLLIFSVSIGSIATPIGSPQNILITSESGLHAPFFIFTKFLLIPTILNLLITTYIIIHLYKIKNARANIKVVSAEIIKNKKNAFISLFLLMISLLTFIINDLFAVFSLSHLTHIGYIPFVYASIMYLLVDNPREIIAEVDWSTILFFIGMFITMEGIWNSHLVQEFLGCFKIDYNNPISTVIGISAISILLSQLLSNVPFVKLYISYLHSQGIGGSYPIVWIALAMASSIAGNATIFGAASNIIVIESIESRSNTTISYLEFLKIGLFVTAVNIIIYWGYILFVIALNI